MKKNKKSKIKKIVCCLCTGFVIAGCFCFVCDLIVHYEKYNSVAKYHLLLDINNNNTEAINFYNENYIKDDIYLFDGEKTFDLFTNKYNITGNKKEFLYNEYLKSGMSLQKFIDNYKKNINK